MPRQKIPCKPANDQWLKAPVESREFPGKSDVVNDLIGRNGAVRLLTPLRQG
jgi:hypothetical protein